ncbi:MAG: SCO1664 family protein [Actinocatenispora sp.]
MTDSAIRLIGAAELTLAEALDLLRRGTLDLEGRLAEASNITMRAFITADGRKARCVYKPVQGERPLWDFPDGTLAGREVAAYLVSAATGWDIVPPTVLRGGPAGTGACQLWIDGDDSDELLGFVPVDDLPADWHSIASARGPDGERFVLAHAPDDRLARMAVFDVVINNADRKGAHVVCGTDGRVHGVDHGVSFHAEDKLRTVLWGWAGHDLPADITDTLRSLRDGLSGDLAEQLHEHLTIREVAATAERVDRLLSAGRYPMPGDDWPALPWPPI